MYNLLLLLVFMGNAHAAWQEKEPSTQVMIEPKLIGGGGNHRRSETNPRIVVQRLVVPTNPPMNSRHIALTVGMNQNNIEVVNLRGHMEAQNIDIGHNRSWWNRLLECISGWCGSRIRPLTPPRLERQLSYYPGRSDTETPFK